MSDLVDYKKRDADLPPGCKELIDLLKPIGEADLDRLSQRDEPATGAVQWKPGPISDISTYVQALFASRAPGFDLWINNGWFTNGRITVTIWKEFRTWVNAVVELEPNSERGRAVLDFLASRGFKVSDDPSTGYWYSSYHFSPLPSHPMEIAQVVLDIFRHAGATEYTAIQYCYRERFDSP